MSQVKIDKGIPFPAETRGNASKYPWDKMEVGDSFAGSKWLGNIAVKQAAKRGWRLTTRVEGDGRHTTAIRVGPMVAT